VTQHIGINVENNYAKVETSVSLKLWIGMQI